MDVARQRQLAVVAAYVAGGILLGALLWLETRRLVAGDMALWKLFSGS
jgi:hypothetical protein